MKPTLFLLAAGMGSRYGGLKQLDTLGPQGQSIMDYSIYDAIQAGFGKIVWVIRRDLEEQFRTQILMCLANFASRPLTRCPKASPCPKEEKSPGEQTMRL